MDVFGVALLALGVLSLPLRRRWPVAVLAFTYVTTLTYWAANYGRGPVFYSLIVALAQVVLSGRRRVAIVSVVAGFIGFPWLGQVLGTTEGPALGEMIALGAWLVTLLSVMELVRSRREHAREQARSRAEARQRQASDERLRIAQELHDAVAHNISLINIHAGVALHLFDEQPEQARDALATIKQSSKEALVELRSILGLLRRADEDAPRAPTPSLTRLDELVARSNAAGLEVEIDVEGDLANLPRNIDVAAYRIIQESLTNVARHADRPDALVRVRADADALNVEVLDEGSFSRSAPDLPSGGNGIAGMRERAMAIGGSFEAGPRPGPRLRRTGAVADRRDRMIRVLLVDDQALVRGGLRALLDAQPDICVVGEAGDGAAAALLAVDLVPDVVLMDIRMPGVDGLAATKTITADAQLADVRIVILTTFDLDEYVFEALRSGASGFLVKDTEPVELIRAVRAVASGDALLSPRATRSLVEEYAARAKPADLSPELDLLTDREREVMTLVAAGLSNDEIAERLYISPTTAKTHVSRTMIKLGARDRAQLVVYAYETGLVRPGWTD